MITNNKNNLYLVKRGKVVESEKSVDLALVRRVKKGDSHAFDLLVLKYQHKIAKVIARYIKDNSEVSDVVQEVFIKTYRAIHGFRGDSAFYTWLYRVAVNTAKNYILAQDRRPPDTDIDASEAEFFPGRNNLQESASPEHIVLRDEIEETVYHAIANLPAELRMAITLRELEGLSYEKIAEVMNCPVGTVRSRIFRAREAIDKEVNPLLEQ